MRKPLLLAAALALLPTVPALAQRPASPRPASQRPAAQRPAAQQPTAPRQATPRAAPKLELTAEHRAELQQAVIRGRALGAIDRAARVTSIDMLTRIPDPAAAGVVGWVALPEGNGITVTYYARQGEGYEAVYRGQVLGGRVTSPQVFAAGSRPALTGPAVRMAAARAAAATVENAICGGPEFNALVLPPEGPGPVLVYRMSPRLTPAKIPAGGHYRISVSPDGTVAQSTALAGACTELSLPPVPRGQRARPLVVNARESLLPNELHVFLSLWTGRPIVVATGTDAVRLWGVTPEGIGELQQ
jgi:hypothetical protein